MSMSGQKLKCNVFDNLSKKSKLFFKCKHHFVSGVEAAEREHNQPSQMDKSRNTASHHNWMKDWIKVMSRMRSIYIYHNEYNNI